MPACSKRNGPCSFRIRGKSLVNLPWITACAGTTPLRRTESHGRSANLSLTTPNPAAGGRLGAAIFEATCNCTFVKNYPYAIGPRLGIAYAINDKTVFRGGWGIAYGFPNDINIQNTAQLTTNAVGVSAFNPLNVPGTVPQPVWPNFDVAQTPLPGGITSGFLAYLDPNASRPPRQNQWSVGLQREITHNFVLEASYVGNRGVWWSLPGVTGQPGPYGYLNQVAPSTFASLWAESLHQRRPIIC